MSRPFTTIPRRIIEDALLELRDNEEGINPEYSGRGMFGETCFAVSFDNPADLCGFGFILGRAAMEAEEDGSPDISGTLESLVDRTKVDQLGNSIVAYFPGFTLDQS
jgi:hypothetical protein